MKKYSLLLSSNIVSLLILQTVSFSNGYANPDKKPFYSMEDNGGIEEKIHPRIIPTRRHESLPLQPYASDSWRQWFSSNSVARRLPHRAFLAISALGAAIGIGTYINSHKREEEAVDIDYLNTNPLIKIPYLRRTKENVVSLLQRKNSEEQVRSWGVRRVFAEEIKQSRFDKRPKKQKLSTKSPQEVLNDIQTSITEVDTRLSKQKIANKVTVFLGNSEAGKTTIFNYVQKNPLVAKRRLGKFIIDRKNNTNDSEGEIVHGGGSGTSYPSLSKRGDYFDCPGFKETRGIEQDIVNAYSLHKLFEQVENFQLVLVVTEHNISDDRGTPFAELIGQLGEIFPGKENVIKKGLNLIVTKSTNERSINDIKDEILDIREKHADLTAFQEEILDFLGDRRNQQITFFNAPTAEGDIFPDIELVKGRSYINVHDIGTPGISVSPDTREYIKDLAEVFANETSDLFSSVRNRLDDYTQEIIRTHDGTAQQLRVTFGDISNHLSGIQHSSDRFDNDVEGIRTVLTRFDPNLPSDFSSLMERRKFLRLIKPQGLPINLDLNHRGILSELSRDLKPYSERFTRETYGGFVTLRGHIVGISDVSSSDITRLTLCGIKGLLIDEDFTIPGISAAFIAPLWSIQGKRCIDLHGRDGRLITPSYALDGENGRPGEPGDSGGSFYGIVDEIHNAENLTINTSGGNGGKGQDGGKGIKGSDGVDGKEADVKERKQSTCVENDSVERKTLSKILRFPFMANDESRQVFRSGNLGEKGGDAGAGGRKGSGGKKGTIVFESTDFEEISHRDVTIISQDGREGQDGKHGVPGKGGRNGQIFEGIYINNSVDGWALARRVAAEAAAGAGTGVSISWWWGPFGWAAGAIGGGVVGGLTPILSSVADEAISGGWEVKPHMLKHEEFALSGEKPQSLNSEGIKEPKKSPKINYEEIRRNWRTWRSKQ